MPYHHLHARQMLFRMPSRDAEYLLTGKQFIKLSKTQSKCHRIIAVPLLHEKDFFMLKLQTWRYWTCGSRWYLGTEVELSNFYHYPPQRYHPCLRVCGKNFEKLVLEFSLRIRHSAFAVAFAVFIDLVDSGSDDIQNFPFKFTTFGPEKRIQNVLISYSTSNWWVSMWSFFHFSR